MFKNALHTLILFSLAIACGAAELPQLVTELSSDNYQARYNARQALKTLMAEASKPGADAARRAELEIQLRSGLESAADKPARLWIVRMLEWFGSEACVADLEGLLAGSDGDVQDAARRALAANSSKAAAEVLSKALAEASAKDKPAYIDALVFRGDDQAGKAIAKLLKSEDPLLVAASAEALGKLKHKKSLKKLNAAREQSSDELRPVIASAMLTIGVTPSMARELLRTADANAAVRVGAFRQLAEQNSKEALQVLQEIIADPGVAGRAAILRAAMETADAQLVNVVVATLPQVHLSDQKVILGAIADFKLADYEKDLLFNLSASTGASRDAVIKTLGVIGGDASFDPLYALFVQQPDNAVKEALARLQTPAVDTRLFDTLKNETDEQKKISAIQLLSIRVPDGTVEAFNELVSPSQPEAIRKTVFKELETAGNVESCRLLASVIVQQDSLKRPAQQSLKKLSVNLGIPEPLWKGVYQPALTSAPNDVAREDLLAILDGVAGPGSLAYLDGLVSDPAHPLRSAAIRSLSRWNEMGAGDLWINVMTKADAAEEDLKAAQAGLIRLINQGSGHPHEKEKLAVKSIQKAPNAAIKEGILKACKRPKNHQKKHFDRAFNVLLDDPDVGLKVYALLGKTPPPPPPPPPLPAPKEAWESLVGATLEEHWTTQGGWVLQEAGVIHLPTQEYQHWRHYQNYLVLKDRMMADFELEFDWRTEQNSGIYFHIPDLAKVDGGQHVEVQIFDNNKLNPDKPLNDHAAGGIIPHHAPTKNTIRPSGEWNTFHIRCVDNQITVKLNGELVNEANLNEGKAGERSKSGGFAFQDHGYAVWLKNIRLKNLDQAGQK